MSKQLKETIKDIVRDHLKKGYIAMGQCLTAVGWVGGTLPELFEKDGMIELSMADVAGGGFAVGAALAGKRPIYIIRYQGFNWFNAPIIINYACKSMEIWNRPCPLMIRSIAMEGAIGPVAGSAHVSLYYRMPGIKICSPMTNLEYEEIYENFMQNNDVLYVSEHRGAFSNTQELRTISHEDADILLLGISITRFEAVKIAEKLINEGLKISVEHLLWLKPLVINQELINKINKTKYGFIVLDNDYENGISKNIAFDIMHKTTKKGYVLGLKDRSAGFSTGTDNLPPNEEDIKSKIYQIINLAKKENNDQN